MFSASAAVPQAEAVLAALRKANVPRAVFNTGGALATGLAAALGHQVRWRTVEPAEYERMLAPHLGTENAAGMAGVYTPPPPGTPPPPEPDPAVVRIGTTTLSDWAARADWGDTAPGRPRPGRP